MTKVEEVARAIDPEAWAEDMPVPTRELVIEFHARRQKSVAMARAAIEAMRRPTPKMLLAALPYVVAPSGLSAEHALSAMITAALSE